MLHYGCSCVSPEASIIAFITFLNDNISYRFGEHATIVIVEASEVLHIPRLLLQNAILWKLSGLLCAGEPQHLPLPFNAPQQTKARRP